uniref:Uncharacterized protein n=1 Tax=Astatotilapia calliptera TaxID=8154 RepID=A0AAX7UGU0_ASTCA
FQSHCLRLTVKSNHYVCLFSCSLYLFSCTIQGNIFINYFLNTGFFSSLIVENTFLNERGEKNKSIGDGEFHHISQLCIAMKIAIIVVTVSQQTVHLFEMSNSYQQ